MLHQLHQSCQWLRFGAIIGIIGCLGWTILIDSAQAAELTTQSVTGVADTADAIVQDWQSLIAPMPVEAGNFVRTDFGAAVELRGIDGSQISIAEATQLLVKEFKFDPNQQVRVAQFAVLEGTVTADAAHLAYATNVFEIETPTVVASFKFSKLTVLVEKNGNTKLIPLSGMFEFWRIGETGQVVVNYISRKGVKTTLEIPKGGNVGFESTVAGVTIVNNGNTPFNVTIGDNTIEMPPHTNIEASTSGGLLPTKRSITNVSTTMNAVGKGATSSSVPSTSGGVESDSTIELPPPAPREEPPRTVRIKIQIRRE